MPIWKFTLNSNILSKKEQIFISDLISIKTISRIIIEEDLLISDNFGVNYKFSLMEEIYINDTISLEDIVLMWLPVTNNLNQGYGYNYGDDYGYTKVIDIAYFRIEIYNTLTNVHIRTEEIPYSNLMDDLGIYVYSRNTNILDNGSYVNTNLTFKVYSINIDGISSLVKTVSI